mgnify:FL=1
MDAKTQAAIVQILNGMKQVKMGEIPACSFCGKPAVIDAPTLTGQWGYGCMDCLADKFDLPYAVSIGSRLIQAKKPENQNTEKKCRGIDINIRDVMESDELREVQCELCENIHTLEVDASGPMKCHDCGAIMIFEALF